MSSPRQAALAPELAPDGVAWCAVNFAYLMAEDVRRALLDVEGISQVTVRLRLCRRWSPWPGTSSFRLSAGGRGISNFRSHLQRGASQHLLGSASDRSALFCSGRLRGVELSIPLFDAAGPPMPGYGGADVVRASALARSGDLRLRLAVSQGKNLIIEAQRATLAAS